MNEMGGVFNMRINNMSGGTHPPTTALLLLGPSLTVYLNQRSGGNIVALPYRHEPVGSSLRRWRKQRFHCVGKFIASDKPQQMLAKSVP